MIWLAARSLIRTAADTVVVLIQPLTNVLAFGPGIASLGRRSRQESGISDCLNWNPVIGNKKGDSMAMEEKHKCAHPSCNCLISTEDQYCSAQCAAMADIPDIDCRCSHAACKGRAH